MELQGKLSLSCEIKPNPKIKLNLAGCNFDCRGCFALAKRDWGRSFKVEELLKLIQESSQLMYGGMVEDIQLTGGEPSLNRGYTIKLLLGLRRLDVSNLGFPPMAISYHQLIHDLRDLECYLKLDLKAYSDPIHRWYTGKPNSNVLRALELGWEHGLELIVRTILIPGLVDLEEISKIIP